MMMMMMKKNISSFRYTNFSLINSLLYVISSSLEFEFLIIKNKGNGGDEAKTNNHFSYHHQTQKKFQVSKEKFSLFP